MIDITFDFRSDSKGKDPDAYSPTLNAYHKALCVERRILSGAGDTVFEDIAV